MLGQGVGADGFLLNKQPAVQNLAERERASEKRHSRNTHDRGNKKKKVYSGCTVLVFIVTISYIASLKVLHDALSN